MQYTASRSTKEAWISKLLSKNTKPDEIKIGFPVLRLRHKNWNESGRPWNLKEWSIWIKALKAEAKLLLKEADPAWSQTLILAKENLKKAM